MIYSVELFLLFLIPLVISEKGDDWPVSTKFVNPENQGEVAGYYCEVS